MKKNDLYIKIITLLKERGMTQSDLAHLAKIPQPSLSRIMSGKYQTKIDTIEKIAKAFNISSGDLLDDKNFLHNVNIGTHNSINVNANKLQDQLAEKVKENGYLKQQIEILKDTIKLLEIKIKK